MNRRALLAAIALVVVAGAAAFFLMRRGESQPDGNQDPTDSRWLCTDPGCGKDFALSFAQLGAFYDEHPGENPVCPACGKNATARAAACPSCGKTVPKADRERSKTAPKCPHCGKPL